MEFWKLDKFYIYLSGKIFRIGFYIIEYGCVRLYWIISMGLGLWCEEWGDWGFLFVVWRVYIYLSGKNFCVWELFLVIN